MQPSDRVILTVRYDCGGTAWSATCICSYKTALDLIEQKKDISIALIEWKGIVNDVDQSEVEFAVVRDAVICIDILKVGPL